MSKHPLYFTKLLPQLAPLHTIFDVGCDRLEFSTPEFREVYPDAEIHAFECDPRHIAHIQANHTDEKLRVHFYPWALADKPGRRQFWQSSDAHPFSGSLRTPKGFANEPGQLWHFKRDPISVHCTTLDLFCAAEGIRKIDLLHMDVQAAESLVLLGAEKMIPHIHYISAEHNVGDYTENPGMAGILALLPGWEIIESYPYDFVLKNPAYEHANTNPN